MKHKKKGKLKRILVVVCVIGLLTYFSIQLVKQEKVLKQQEQQIKKMQEEKKKRDEEYAQLVIEVKNKGSVEYIERYMRERFGMVKKNEFIISNKEQK